MSDLIERLRGGLLWHDTFQEVQIMDEAADKLEAQTALIAELVSALTALRDETIVSCPDCADQVEAALSKAKLATTAEKSV